MQRRCTYTSPCILFQLEQYFIEMMENSEAYSCGKLALLVGGAGYVERISGASHGLVVELQAE